MVWLACEIAGRMQPEAYAYAIARYYTNDVDGDVAIVNRDSFESSPANGRRVKNRDESPGAGAAWVGIGPDFGGNNETVV